MLEGNGIYSGSASVSEKNIKEYELRTAGQYSAQGLHDFVKEYLFRVAAAVLCELR